MTPDQMFIIAILTLTVPIISAVVTIVGGVILFDRQNKKIDATHDVAVKAAVASGRAETAANHSKEVVSALQANFQAVVKVINPEAAAQVAMTMPAQSNNMATPVLDARETGTDVSPATTPNTPITAIKVEVVNIEPVPVVDASGRPIKKDAAQEQGASAPPAGATGETAPTGRP